MTDTAVPATVGSRTEQLNLRLADLNDQIAATEAKHGSDRDAWSEGVRERVANLQTAITTTENDLTRFTERAEKVEAIRAAAMDPANRESGSENTPAVPTARPVSRTAEQDRAARLVDENYRADVISDAVADTITELLRLPSARSLDMARWVEAAGDTNYLTAFGKRLADPISGHLGWTTEEANAHRAATEYARTSLSLSGASSMLPLALDPSIALSNTGSTGGIRSVCRHETIATNAWNGVTSTGATAEWKVENAQAADGTPTVAGKNIPVYLLDVDAVVSYEIEMDGLNFAQELSKVLYDAAAVAVDAALATGSGSGAPTGIMTALTGSQDVVTAGAFSAANVVSLQNALPARFQANAKFVTSLPVRNSINSFETTNGAPRFPETSGGRLLNRDMVEDSDLATDMTTSGSRFAVYGDWSQYLQVTRTGASIEVLPNYGANGRPTASRHYFLTLRVGADALVPNAFRVLKKS